MSKTENVARVLEHAGHVLYRTGDGEYGLAAYHSARKAVQSRKRDMRARFNVVREAVRNWHVRAELDPATGFITIASYDRTHSVCI